MAAYKDVATMQKTLQDLKTQQTCIETLIEALQALTDVIDGAQLRRRPGREVERRLPTNTGSRKAQAKSAPAAVKKAAGRKSQAAGAS